MPIICIVGRSGSGKTTLEEGLIKANIGITKLPTNTSREPREGEVNGVHYYFRTNQEFKELYKSGKLIEHVQYSGNYYGVSIPEDEPYKTYVLAIEPIGYKNIVERLGKEKVTGIFLDIAPHKVIRRLVDRVNLLPRLENDEDHFRDIPEEIDIVIDADHSKTSVLKEVLAYLKENPPILK